MAALGLGRHAVVAGELEVLTATYPLRERLWGLRALALARSGRQADALDVLRSVRDSSPTSSVWSRGRSCASCRPRCCGRTRPWRGAHRGRRPRVAGASADARGATQPVGRPTPGPAWPLVGRGDQLAALVGTLVQSQERPVFAVVTGDPGIGKSRLCAELATVAQSEGARVLVGRCSQDDGAPPL